MMAPPAIVEATGLHTYYGASHIVQGVDIAVHAGEAVALMGRNGMGKTTLLRSLLGLTPARAGTVTIDGNPVTGFTAHRIARLGLAYVPENRGIFPNLSVRENLVMAARPALDGRADWNLDRVLGLFPRLAERLHQSGALLSGGEQQMLTIARALLTNPRLLILDEATEGLAPLIAQDIWHTIRTIRESGMAAIVVDKNYTALAELADRCVILLKGRKVFDDSPRALVAQPELRARYLGV